MHATINSLSVGRSVGEALRVLKSLLFVSNHEGQVLPADWEDGRESMTASADGMREYLVNH